MDYDDFVVYKNDSGEFIGGGYKIDSLSLKTTLDEVGETTGGVQTGGATVFENLAVPAGLFFMPKAKSNECEDCPCDLVEPISDDLFDKLYGLVDASKKQKKTKKQSILTMKPNKNNKSTRRKKHKY